MAQILPLTAEAGDRDGAQQALVQTLAGLPERWTLLRDRPLAGGVTALLVHPDIGIALVDVAPRDPAAAAAELQDFLAQERFAEFFPGDLPVVSVGVAEEEIPQVGDHLAAAFEAAPRLSVADPDWADSVIELLLQPGDVAMAPAGQAAELPTPAPRWEAPEATPEARSIEIPPLSSREPPSSEPEAERTPASRPEHAWSERSWDDETLTLPLRERQDATQAYGARYFPPGDPEDDAPRRRRWLLGAVVGMVLLLGGTGLAIWEENTTDSDSADNTGAAAQIEVPLAPQHPATGSAPDQASAPPILQRAPPVPPAPPVMMAAKPFAAPPPKPPRPTAVEPLPERTAAAPPPSPAPAPAPPPPAAAPTPAPVASTPAPAPAPVASSTPAPPPAHPAATAQQPAPTQTAAAALPPPTPVRPRPSRRTQHTESESKRLMERELNAEGRHAGGDSASRPPIDAADLPPLDGPAPVPPSSAPPSDDHAVPPPPASLSDAASAAQPTAVAPGQPIPLRRAVSDPPSIGGSDAPRLLSTAALSRDCHSYTASSSLSGRQIPVQGTVCRDSEGQWRVVSEVPQH